MARKHEIVRPGFHIDFGNNNFNHAESDVTEFMYRYRIRHGSQITEDNTRAAFDPAEGSITLINEDGRFTPNLGNPYIEVDDLQGDHLCQLFDANRSEVSTRSNRKLYTVGRASDVLWEGIARLKQARYDEPGAGSGALAVFELVGKTDRHWGKRYKFNESDYTTGTPIDFLNKLARVLEVNVDEGSATGIDDIFGEIIEWEGECKDAILEYFLWTGLPVYELRNGDIGSKNIYDVELNDLTYISSRETKIGGVDYGRMLFGQKSGLTEIQGIVRNIVRARAIQQLPLAESAN